jgi:hypothetical protein
VVCFRAGVGWFAILLASCSFQHGSAVDDAGAQRPDYGMVGDTANPPGDTSTPIDAPPNDAPPPPMNLVASNAGGSLVSFTSEYCTANNPPLLCQTGYWNHTNINDSQHANGDNTTAYRNAWASTNKQNTNPEELEFAFSNNKTALIDRFVVQNWGRGNGVTLYYSTHAKIYGRDPLTMTWTMLVDTALATNETPQTFMLTDQVVVDRVRLSITDGLRTDYWELGEFETWGWLQ